MVRIVDFRRQSLAAPTQRVGDFVSEAFPGDRRNTRYVSLASVVPTRRGWRCTTVTKIPGEAARRYTQFIYPPRGYRGTFRACKGLQVDCACMRYLYVFNYALNEENLAVRDRTNGEPPVVTNPDPSRLGLCKHGIVVLRYLIRDNPSFPHGGSSGGGAGSTVPLTTLRQARR